MVSVRETETREKDRNRGGGMKKKKAKTHPSRNVIVLLPKRVVSFYV